MEPHRLDRTEARRIAIRAQLLDAARPRDLVELVRRLTLLQIDPTAAIAPNADLVAWSRLGSAYRPADLAHALEHERRLFELDALIRPIEDLELLRADMATWPTWQRSSEWLDQNQSFRRDILDRLGDSPVPVLSRDIPDTSHVSWASTGWTHNRNVGRMLELLTMRGEVAIAARRGRERLWTLADRVYPAELLAAPVLPADEALRRRNERRLAALGIAREKSTMMPLEPVDVGQAGEPAVVDGVPGVWRVDPAQLGQPFTGRTALLSPFDRLTYDRVRAQQLFDFEYVLEMYKPAAKRRWGYFALPILHGDRLVGKLDAAVDRKAGTLTVNAVHEDVPFDRATRVAVDDEVASLAEWLGVTA
ncbi:DNA glycosylase AlkZ-like family protein [Agromyces subbeticus]|uniref:DNA glycosylase AlkZ-like family protein n=1 Tax=Agromyces subbeticus TaxID=293890 RepID=UPI00047D936F|nr:crosslink repair DNA glycosylase YcaQ family protein [Agromyces subbeticus]